METFFQLIISGLTLGSIYGLIGLGFTLIFRASKIINFAQGEFVMLGGVITACLIKSGFPYFISAIIAISIVIAVGMLFQLLVLRPIKDAPLLILIMITVGGSIFISNTTGIVLNTLPQALPPFIKMPPIILSGIVISSQTIWVWVATALLLIILYIIAKYTIIGKAIEASAEDSLGAALLGINQNLMMMLAFGISGAIGAIAGIFVTPIFFIKYNSGIILGLKGFVGAIVGGWGKYSGAILGGILIGVAESLSLAFISAGYKDAVIFGILLVILSIRPKGILGSTEMDERL